MQQNVIPWALKIFPAVVGAILVLVLSGDIDANGKMQVSLGVITKFVCSVTVSLNGGSVFIEHYGYLTSSTMFQ